MSHRRFESYTDTLARLFPEELETQKKVVRDGNVVSARTITFQVTDACNLACKYCYQINKSHHRMPFEVAKKFIDLILDCDENTAQYIDAANAPAGIIEFIGGEPFLEIDLIDQICDYFLEQCILRNHPWAVRHMISICSNGVLYFDPKVQAFLQKHKGHLSFSISIDGNKQLHDSCRVFPDGSGSYDIAMAGVNHWINVMGGTMGSKMTLAPENIMYTCDAVKGLIESGYEEINLNCVYEEGWTAEHATILYYQLKELTDYILESGHEDTFISIFDENFFKPKTLDDDQNWCGGNGMMISVDYKGDIYPCIRYMESSLGGDVPPLIVGNIHDGICVKPEHKSCSECLKSINRLSQSTDECIYCPIAEGCSWCQAYNYQHSGGDINKRATYICIMHKARALGNCYYWNMYYRLTNQNKRMKLWLPDDEALKIISQEELDFLHFLEQP